MAEAFAGEPLKKHAKLNIKAISNILRKALMVYLSLFSFKILTSFFLETSPFRRKNSCPFLSRNTKTGKILVMPYLSTASLSVSKSWYSVLSQVFSCSISAQRGFITRHPRHHMAPNFNTFMRPLFINNFNSLAFY